MPQIVAKPRRTIKAIEKVNILRSHIAEWLLNGMFLARGPAIVLNGGLVCA